MVQNNTSNNVLSYEYKTQYRIYTWKQNFEKHFDVLLLLNSQNSHHVLIKYFERFMTYRTKYYGNRNSITYNASLAQKYEKKKYLTINHAKSLLLSGEDDTFVSKF